MKLTTLNKRKAQGFTLIEMIGVLAVIAILAALLIPKIFEAINNARINNAAVSVGSVKTAVADHYAKFGTIACTNGVALPVVAGTPVPDFDRVLLGEGFLDKPFAVKIGSPTNTVRLIAGSALTTAAVTLDGSTGVYDLSGDGDPNDSNGSVVVEGIIYGATEADGRDLSMRLDGEALSEALGTDDSKGRVKFDANGAATTIYVYLTHR